MKNGTVEFYNSERGFGYIKPEGDTGDVRILISAISRAGLKKLTAGQKVKFDTHADPNSGKIIVNKLEVD